MADAETADDTSLTSKFNWKSTLSTIGHISMWFMMINMAFMALPTVAVAGTSLSYVPPSFGGLDWIANFGQMFYSDLDKVTMVPEALSTVWDNGLLSYNGVEAAHHGVEAAAHTANHVAGEGVKMAGHCTAEAFNQVMNGMSAEDFKFNQELAQSTGGDMLKQLESLCHAVK